MEATEYPIGSLLMKHNEFLISDIMPKREVHLIAGPSGSGKTTLTIQGIPIFRSGGEWLGKTVVQPFEAIYISCDRSKDSFKRSLDNHGIPHDLFPWSVEENIPRGVSPVRILDIMRWVKTNHPTVELVIFDGFLTLLQKGNQNDAQTVLDFLRGIRKSCEVNDLTVLGILHSPKTRENDLIANPRQRVAGTVAWGAFSDLIIIVEPEDAKHSDNPNRTIHVLPRQSAEYTLHYRHQGGVLVPIPEIDTQKSLTQAEAELESAEPGTIYSTANLRDLCYGVPNATFTRWVSLQVGSGTLVRLKRGMYKRFG